MKPPQPTDRRTGYILIFLFSLLTTGILVSSYYAYRSYENKIQSEVENQLLAITDLKIGQLTGWRKERLGDGSILLHNQGLSLAIKRFMKNKNDLNARKEILSNVSIYDDVYNYHSITILDNQFNSILRHPENLANVKFPNENKYEEELRSGKIVFQDFYRTSDDGKIYLNILIPIRDNTYPERLAAIVALTINPDIFLYPLINQWPTPSRTAETLIIRKNSNDALFLNELKFQKNTALTLKIPLTKTDVPAVKAVLGQQGIVSGKDYRGVNVFACVKSIPQSPWFIVARMDMDEVYAPLKEWQRYIILMICTLIISVTSGLGYIWRRQRSRSIEQQLQAAEALRVSEMKYRQTFDVAPVGIVLAGIDKQIIQCNDAFARLIGFTSEELAGKTIAEITHPEDKEIGMAELLQLKDGKIDSSHIQKRYVRRDGNIIWGEVTISMVRDSEKRPQYFFAIIQDITDRMIAEEQLQLLKYSIDTAPDGSYWMDSQGKFVYVNDSGCKILGYTQEELLTMSVFNVNPKVTPERWKQVWQLIKENHHFISQTVHRRKDGSEFPVEITSAYVKFGGLEYCNGFAKDISDRLKTEQKIKESEGRYSSLFNSMNEGVVLHEIVYDDHRQPIDYRIIDANPAFEKNTGMRIDNARNQLATAFYGTGVPPYLEIYKQVAETGMPARFETYFQPLKKYFEISVTSPAKGKFSTIFTDITGQKESRLLLEESEARFRSIIESTEAGYFFIDTEGIIRDVNPAWIQLYKYRSKDEIVGKHFTEIQKIDEVEAAQALVREILSGNKSYRKGEFSRKCNDGSIGYHTFSANPLIKEGKTLGLEGFIIDITERKKTENELRKNEALLKTAVENLPIIFYMIDTGGIFRLSIGAGLKGLGLEQNQVVGQSVFEIYKDYPEIINSVKTSLGGEPSTFTSTVRGTSYDNYLVPLMDQEGAPAGLVAVALDVTENKKLQLEMFQMQKMESIGTLAGGIAHDFNNILAILLSQVASIPKIKDDTDKMKKTADTLVKTVGRGKSLVQQILMFARKTETKFGPVNVNDLIMEVTVIILETFPKTIRCIQEYDKNIPYIHADHSQIHQVLLNLCVNARDAMPEGGSLKIRTNLVSSASILDQHPHVTASSYVIIEVSDTGMGMAEEVRARIFEPFYTTKGIGKGTGLGLAVVFGIIQAHKGFIEVESVVGSGTTFRVYLPSSQEKDPVQKENEETLENIMGGKETLLIVEDEQALLAPLELLLNAKGYTVLTANDGARALEIYKEHANTIALVMTDLGLPKISGLQICREMKMIHPDQNVILATGYLEPEMRDECLKSGISNFIFKPYEISDVLKAIRKILDAKKI